jgi:hypothetical protein
MYQTDRNLFELHPYGAAEAEFARLFGLPLSKTSSHSDSE